MSIVSTLTPLMDKFREKTGLTDKLTIARATGLIDHLDLHVNPNMLPTIKFVVNANKAYPNWSEYHFNFNLNPGTYTFSWKAKTDSTSADQKVRIRLLDAVKNITIPSQQELFGVGMIFPLTDKAQSYTFDIPDDGNSYALYCYGSGGNVPQTWDVTFYDCKLELGDLATPLTTVGGVVKAVLSALHLERRCLA